MKPAVRFSSTCATNESVSASIYHDEWHAASESFLVVSRVSFPFPFFRYIYMYPFFFLTFVFLRLDIFTVTSKRIFWLFFFLPEKSCSCARFGSLFFYFLSLGVFSFCSSLVLTHRHPADQQQSRSKDQKRDRPALLPLVCV